MPRAASAGTPTLSLAPCGQGWGLHVSSILGTWVWPELCWSCRSLRCCHCPWADLGPVLQFYLQLLPTGLLARTLILIPLVLVLLSAPDAVSPLDPVVWLHPFQRALPLPAPGSQRVLLHGAAPLLLLPEALVPTAGPLSPWKSWERSCKHCRATSHLGPSPSWQ